MVKPDVQVNMVSQDADSNIPEFLKDLYFDSIKGLDPGQISQVKDFLVEYQDVFCGRKAGPDISYIP